MSEIRAELVPGSVWSVTFNNPETGETIAPSGPRMMALEFDEHGVVTRMYPVEDLKPGDVIRLTATGELPSTSCTLTFPGEHPEET